MEERKIPTKISDLKGRPEKGQNQRAAGLVVENGPFREEVKSERGKGGPGRAPKRRPGGVRGCRGDNRGVSYTPRIC